MLFDAFDAPVIRARPPGPLGVVAALAGHAVALTRAMAPLTTLWGVLGRSFHDPRLRQPFRRHAPYVGGSPMLSPALLMLVWRSEAAGVWTVAGGIWRRGADLRCNARVTRIMAEGGRASGVELADGTRIAADAVIFNGDPSALGAGLLGPEAMRAAKAVAPKHRSLSACVRAFSAEATGFALIRHTVFFGDDIFARRRPPRDPAVSVCAQDRPGRDAPRPLGPERFEITMNAPAEGDRTPCRRGTSIDASSQHSTDWRRRACGCRCGPDRRPRRRSKPCFRGRGARFTGAIRTGRWRRFSARPRDRSCRVCIWRSGTHPGPGAPMATLSGRHAAEAMLPDLASTAPSRRGGARGGTSTLSPTTGRAR